MTAEPEPGDGLATRAFPSQSGPNYLAPELVIPEWGRHGAERLRLLTPSRILLLGVIGGSFITMGALFSTLLASGTDTPGVERLLEGLGFSAGFFFVILSGAALFTEANVVMPATALRRRDLGVGAGRIARFWFLALVGNVIGSLITAAMIHGAQSFPTDVTVMLDEIVERKLTLREEGGAGAWFRLILSGVLANGLVGMAAFFATMGRTIISRYIPVFLAVTMFVSAGFQHSPANMGFFSLAELMGRGPGWDVVVGWNLVPAAIGNMIGGVVLVVLPFYYQIWRPNGSLQFRNDAAPAAHPEPPGHPGPPAHPEPPGHPEPPAEA